MSKIEEAKKKLDTCGYVHPTNMKSSKDKRYMTFDTENTQKKSYESSISHSEYAKFTDKQNLKKLSMSCPQCGEIALYICDCKYKDKQCGNGHVWYRNTKKQIIQNDPHD